MYILSRRMGLGWLGAIFAALTSLAAFGIGNMVQANSVADAARSSFGLAPAVTGGVLAAATAVVVLGGIKRIVEVTQILIPAMCGLYLLGALTIVIRFADQVPGAIGLIFTGAFEGQAAVGGFAGASVGRGGPLRHRARAVFERGRLGQRAAGALIRRNQPSGAPGLLWAIRGLRGYDRRLPSDRPGRPYDGRVAERRHRRRPLGESVRDRGFRARSGGWWSASD